MAAELPCDIDGVCMKCKVKPAEAEAVPCRTCATPWHVQCLSKPPETLALVADWECPDCSSTERHPPSIAGGGGGSSDLIASVRAIEADESMTEREKARRRQELVSGGGGGSPEAACEEENEGGEVDMLDVLGDKFKCPFCLKLPERPVTTPCGHNSCLSCFQDWIKKGKRTCAKCRAAIPLKVASQPRINAALVVAIRMAKTAKSVTSGGPTKVYHFMRNENRPDKAFTTERAKRAGKANACSGQIFVTVPPDHFGPILAENDPRRNQGVLVGETWEDRMECRQWGAHLPHVAGIAGQSEYGSQSVALSGGYEDDEDHGEWFLYTGSGGRDLSGNKRTNKKQSSDQKFEKLNEALRVSCKMGYPVRVVRSHKEKRSAYAPELGVRYDGIYRIEQCWRKAGAQGFKVCRYLFVRCDNEPAPWTSDENGDLPRPLPSIKELSKAVDITVRKGSPSWDYDQVHGWKWMKPPPVSRKPVVNGKPEDGKRARKAMRHAQNLSVQQRVLKEFNCLICQKVMVLPVTTPCAHNFCKSCLLGSYKDQSFVRERTREGGRNLRAQKIVKKCPSCPNEISDFLQDPQINRDLKDLIETLQSKNEEENGLETEGEEGSDAMKLPVEDTVDDETDSKKEVNVLDDVKPNEEIGDDDMDDQKLDGHESNGARNMNLKAVAGQTGSVKGSDADAGEGSEGVGQNADQTKIPRSIKRKNANAGKNPAGKKVKFSDGEKTKAEGSVAVEHEDPMDLSEGAGKDNKNQLKLSESHAQRKTKLVKKTRKDKNTKNAGDRGDGDDSPSSPLLVEDGDDDFQ